MSTSKKIIDLILRSRTPKPSKKFWKNFDRELERKLDTIDRQKSQRRSLFVDKIKDVFGLLFRPDTRPAVAAISLVVIIGATLFFANYQGMRFNSIAALSDEELVDELIIINGLVSEASQPPQRGAVTNGILDELELLYEINPSLELS